MKVFFRDFWWVFVFLAFVAVWIAIDGDRFMHYREVRQKIGLEKPPVEYNPNVPKYLQDTSTSEPEPASPSDDDIIIMTKDGQEAAIPRSAVKEWHEKMGPGWNESEYKFPDG